MPIRVAESLVFDADTASERTITAAELGTLDGVTAGTVTASRAVVVGANKNLDVLAIADGGLALGSGAGTAITSTAAELNRLDASLATNLMARGTGVDTAESYAAGVRRFGSLVVTEIVVDISTLVGSTTDLDIIGETAAANCNWGQVTAAINGTLIGGSVTCLEVPAGGVTDIDFYSATVATGTEDAGIAALTETVLVTSGAAWTSGAVKGMTTVPPANDYLYIVNGAGGVPGTFTAGKFLITLYGLGA
jgi:hypothetical protein